MHIERNLDYIDWKIAPEPNQLEVNCLQNNAYDLKKVDSKFDKFMTKEIKDKWNVSTHREEDTPELHELLKQQKLMAEAEVLRKIQEEKDRKEKEAKAAFQAALDREKKLLEIANE